MKRIAFIDDYMVSEVYREPDTYELCKWMAEYSRTIAAAGYKVDIFTIKAYTGLPEVVRYAPQVQLIILPRTLDPASITGGRRPDPIDDFTDKMLRFIVKNQWVYDLNHVYSSSLTLVASRLKQMMQLPYLFNLDESFLTSVEKKNISFLVRDANHLIATSQQQKKDLIQFYKADPEKISLLSPDHSWKDAARKLLSIYDRVENRRQMERTAGFRPFAEAIPAIKTYPLKKEKAIAGNRRSYRYFVTRIAYFLGLISRAI
ncbi:MAG TPA: hypothetical protein VF939_01920 [Puia sp.]